MGFITIVLILGIQSTTIPVVNPRDFEINQLFPWVGLVQVPMGRACTRSMGRTCTSSHG